MESKTGVISRDKAEKITDEANNILGLAYKQKQKVRREKAFRYLETTGGKLLRKAAKEIEKSAKSGRTDTHFQVNVESRKKLGALGYLLTEQGFDCDIKLLRHWLPGLARRTLFVKWEQTEPERRRAGKSKEWFLSGLSNCFKA